jgi:hypothetical protein
LKEAVFGTVELWILNDRADGEGWGTRESIAGSRHIRSWWQDFPQAFSREAGKAGTRMAMVLGHGLES